MTRKETNSHDEHRSKSLASAAAAAILVATSAAAAAEPIPGVRELSGRLIARPIARAAWQARGLTAAAADARRADAAAAIGRFEGARHIAATGEYLIERPHGRTEADVAAELLATGDFEYVEPDWIVYPLECPNDPLQSSQWHHDAMQSCAAWGLHAGLPSVSVGVCDTGIRVTHEDLLLDRLEGFNAVDELWESQGGDLTDVHGHGTAMTGCAAANGQNALGVTGLGWSLSHRMLKVSNDPSGWALISDLQLAARTAIESGDRVASLSYGGVDAESNVATAAYIRSLGGIMVWSAGNDSRLLDFRNRDDDDLIIVGASTSSDERAGFSAYGPMVDLFAPGVNIFTTSNWHDAAYSSGSGTSPACALTAGLCALIFSTDPELSADDVEAILKGGCDDIGEAGLDGTFGYGRVSTLGSLSLIQSCHTRDLDDDGSIGHGDLAMLLTAWGPCEECATGSTSWESFPLAAQSGSFTIEFDATPEADSIDALVAFSEGAGASFDDYAVLVRFNPDGYIDARDGGGYSAHATVPYSGGQSYRFRLDVDVPNHSYDAFVTPPGGAEQVLATDFAFRTTQQSATTIDHWGVWAWTDGHEVCNFEIDGVFAGAIGFCPEDIDQSGAIDFADLIALLIEWGSCE